MCVYMYVCAYRVILGLESELWKDGTTDGQHTETNILVQQCMGASHTFKYKYSNCLRNETYTLFTSFQNSHLQ